MGREEGVRQDPAPVRKQSTPGVDDRAIWEGKGSTVGYRFDGRTVEEQHGRQGIAFWPAGLGLAQRGIPENEWHHSGGITVLCKSASYVVDDPLIGHPRGGTANLIVVLNAGTPLLSPGSKPGWRSDVGRKSTREIFWWVGPKIILGPALRSQHGWTVKTYIPARLLRAEIAYEVRPDRILDLNIICI